MNVFFYQLNLVNLPEKKVYFFEYVNGNEW